MVDPLAHGLEYQNNESWIALDDVGDKYLVKLWPFITATADDLQRALWDAELRSLYRVSSSSGAEETLLVLRDAGLDSKYKCFVMVMHSKRSGFNTLSTPIQHREPWLSETGLRREQLWRGFRQIAQGIGLLHAQSMLHRNITAENVFYHPDLGPESFRLGGFEWSVRVGELHLDHPPIGWSSLPDPQETQMMGYQPETDWYGFGMLIARCLLNIENYGSNAPVARHRRILAALSRAPAKIISDRENQFMQRLLDLNQQDRLVIGSHILEALDELILSFAGAQANRIEAPLILVFHPSNMDIGQQAMEAGFIPDPTDKEVAYFSRDNVHARRLADFIQRDMQDAQLFLNNETSHILVGTQLSLRVTRIEKTPGRGDYVWDAAFALGVWDLSWNDGGSERKDLPPNSIAVRTKLDWQDDERLRARAQSWSRYLPTPNKDRTMDADLVLFHDFIRCTNQIELLMRDAELFQYEVLESKVENQLQTVVIKEVPRERSPIDALQPEGGLQQLLRVEIEKGKQWCDRVILTSDTGNSLRLDRVEHEETFQVIQFCDDQSLVLQRPAGGNVAIQPPQRGWIRTFGMFGQFQLIRRRTDAIRRLSNHSYLLASLAATDRVYLDTGDLPLPQELPAAVVDEAKQAVMRDTLRTRPIYALQGPPGTGKTTMVAYLLRQIFHDDPVAQVLITAQAHGAVDVLRSKVINDAFSDVPETDQPLAIRLGRNDPEEDQLEGSVEQVASRILQFAIDRIARADQPTTLQVQWMQDAKYILDGIRTRFTREGDPEFIELVKRGANITYCTTSAGDLEELARGTQTYDWAIVEEAGKCHGFDLALPMQAGHRWLLIGDQYQLPPYRYDDYLKAIDNLDAVVEALRSLPRRAGGLLDDEWVARWEKSNSAQRDKFKQFAKDRLYTFRYLFELCRIAAAGPNRPQATTNASVGAVAGKLQLQYRMHPTIGTLISRAYYKGELINQTLDEDGVPIRRVVLPLVNPTSVNEAAIVWLDTPPAWESDRASERGPDQDAPRYINPFEAKVARGFIEQLKVVPTDGESAYKLAVLSPYYQQVSLLRHELHDIALSPGIVPKEELRARSLSQLSSRIRLAHTVDSFQGNEADIVIVSLVRNNTGDRRRPLGFLDKPERMNVLLSRAQRLLVLIGSWEFFRKHAAQFPLDDPLYPEWHFRTVVTVLEEYFSTGKAVKLPGQLFAKDTGQ